MLINHKKVMHTNFEQNWMKTVDFGLFHGFLILPGSFRCHFAYNFLCLRLQYYFFEVKIDISSKSSHFFKSITPRLTPLAKPENDPKIQKLVNDDTTFWGKKSVLWYIFIMWNYRAMHHKWVLKVAFLRFLSGTSFFYWICFKHFRWAIFTPRTLFDNWNGSLCFRHSRQNLTQE